MAQKIQLNYDSDVYRIEHALAEDWVMMSTHDTASIWQLAEEWCGKAVAAEWGRYLAPQLVSEASQAQFAAGCAAPVFMASSSAGDRRLETGRKT